SDGELSAFEDVAVIVQPQPGPPFNAAPVVEAGLPQSLALGTPAFLEGTLSEDGLPGGAVTSWWSQVSGPPGVSFANVADPATSASLPAGGHYVLRLTAFDGQAATADDVSLTVVAPLVVSIQAVENTASEFSGLGPASRGEFTITRDGDFDAALAVQLAISGSASNG